MKIIPCIILLYFASIFSQDKSEWFPPSLNIQPFTANFLEPKGGFHYIMGESEIRLDIGTTADLYHHKNKNKTFSFGADLFTYTRLRGEGEFHFPVEAIDYLFGINAGYKIKNDNIEYGIRFRFSHISAHFVDGKFDYRIYDWRNGDIPRVYSREFFEFFPFYRINGFRAYAGLTYLIHTTPKFIGKGIYQAGFDHYFYNLFSASVSPFIAYDFKLNHVHKFRGNNIISAGVKFGKYNAKGINLMFSYFSGLSIHGEYFDRYERYGSLGINVDI